MERNSGVPSRAGEEIRRRYKERVEARKNGPEELARVLLKQKEEGRQQALERAQQRAAAPKKLAWSALTREELAQRRRDRYQMNKEHFEQKRREARVRDREKLSPEQRSVRRWLKWRERQNQPTPPGRNYPERSRPALAAESFQRALPAPTAADSVKRWLAFREAQKAGTAPQLAMENISTSKRQRSYTHDDDLNDKHRRITRRIEYDFER
jgi:hypothetical protein